MYISTYVNMCVCVYMCLLIYVGLYVWMIGVDIVVAVGLVAETKAT